MTYIGHQDSISFMFNHLLIVLYLISLICVKLILGDKKMIKELQKRLKRTKIIKFYYVPTDDDHQSEIVGEHDQFRKYLSGFTGSAGVLVVGQKEACLWTDGRYFIQAEKELYPGIKLMEDG